MTPRRKNLIQIKDADVAPIWSLSNSCHLRGRPCHDLYTIAARRPDAADQSKQRLAALDIE
jgi:hypothetical protein